jgi:ABC-type antimicrobial peptide transport system permease subunit
LVSLSLHKRIKEIGIRKVLGASLPDITMLFLKEFIFVVIIAGLVACPIAYFIMEGWLADYANRIAISPLPFIGSIAFLGTVVIILICFQTIKAALSNPIKSLRTE